MLNLGRNRNTNDVAVTTTYTVNSTTATTIAVANPDRIFIEIDLDPSSINVEVFIRLYPASDDNDHKGVVITRDTFGNSNLFKPGWRMSADNIYTGEISALSSVGSVDIHVTEY